MNLNGKKVLVTGADGFIGSHLVEELVRRGLQVKAFVHYNSLGSWGWLDHSEERVKKAIEVYSGDVRDPHAVKTALQDCQVVFHLAALIGIPYSYHAPDSYVDTNIKGTLNILQAAKELGVQKIIHTSTSEVYGTARFVPITEDHPLQGQSPYSATKIGADQLALSFFQSFQTPVSIVRPFNTYGPRQSARAVLPTIISQIASGKSKIKLGALHPTRDFNYVMDTVYGFIACAESEKSIGEVINLGSGFEISIGKTVELIAELMGKKIEVESEQVRLRPETSEVERLCADRTKAKTLTGWEPKLTGMDGLRDGLAKTIDWFSHEKNLNFYKVGTYQV